MKVFIEFECDNADFEDSFEGALRCVLSSCITKVLKQRSRSASVCTAPEAADKLYDVNGNTIGYVRLLKEE